MNNKMLIIILFFIFSSYSKADWTQTNGIFGGTANKMYSYENKIFVGTPSSGIYLSYDNGYSFVLRNDGLPELDITDFTSEGNAIYAGTRTSGVFKSTNEGLNWFAVNSGLTNLRISSLAVNGTKIFAANDSGIFRSTNSGFGWTSVNNNTSGYGFSSITSSLNTIFITGTYTGIFRSTDDGDNWDHVLESSTGIFKTIVSSDSNIFACGLLTGIRRSTDLGLTWTSLNFITSIVYSLGVNGSTVFAGIGGNSSNLYISTDNGNNWESSSDGLPNTDYTSVLSVLFNTSNLFVVLPEGVYKSTNTGQTWFNSSSNIIASSISALYNFNNRIYAASYENGISYTNNNGSNWTDVNQDLSSPTVISIGSCDSVLFIGTYGGNYKSTNYGTNWILSNLGLSGASTAFISNSGMILAGEYIPYKSTDYGQLWFPASSGFISGGGKIKDFTQIGNYTYSVNSNRLFLSPNFGVFWVELINPWFYSEVNALTSYQRYLYVGHGDSGIYKTDSLATSWTRINNGLTNKKIRALYTNSNKVFAGTQGGVFVTTNNGSNWHPLNNGLTNLYITSIISDATYLFAGTRGSGIWKIPLSEILTDIKANTNDPVTFYLYQNYPNPFNPVTNLEFGIPELGFVSLKVYNLLGKEVAVLVNEKLSPGIYKETFNGSNFASGVYFYRLVVSSSNPMEAGDFSDVKRMILLK